MPPDDENKAEPNASSSMSPAVVIAVVGALSGLLGGGINAYMNLRSERQKSVYEGQTQAQKSADDLKTEQEKAAAQLAIQQRQAQAQIDLQKFQSDAQLKIEKLKVEGTLGLEKEKQDASERLAKQEFETKLIMQAVQGVPPEVATKNLQFFLSAGFINDPDGKIAQLSVKAPPAIPAPGGQGIVLSTPKACTELADVDFRGTATPMTDNDVKEVASSIGIEPAVLQAVLFVQARGRGFSGGRPNIHFEPGTFSRLTGGKFDSTNPSLSSRTGSAESGDAQYARLREAMPLDCGAALASTSWGISQLTGANFRSAGFTAVDDFIRTQMISERAQLETLVKYLYTMHEVEFLQKKDWAGFARKYDGAGSFNLAAYVAKYTAAYERARSASQ